MSISMEVTGKSLKKLAVPFVTGLRNTAENAYLMLMWDFMEECHKLPEWAGTGPDCKVWQVYTWDFFPSNDTAHPEMGVAGFERRDRAWCNCLIWTS